MAYEPAELRSYFEHHFTYIAGFERNVARYGRSPAIDLTVPREVAGDQPSAAALDLTDVVTTIPADRHCLSVQDVG